MGMTLNISIAFSNIAIFTILILLIHEHGLSLPLLIKFSLFGKKISYEGEMRDKGC
jgi:hypothetical protein